MMKWTEARERDARRMLIKKEVLGLTWEAMKQQVS